MAGTTNADSHPGLSVELPPSLPPPIPKDMQGSDNSIPLSPQWLLPKHGDNKIGIESNVSSYHGIHPEAVKTSGNGENFHDAEKKKDVFRPSFHDTENARRDRWREEERETNFTIRRDRWREGDKELGDSRKAERWTDTARHAGDARRPPSERRNDSSNKESNFDQRRESKWNTRWGPDDKDSESWREKWSDFGRENEVSREKGTAQLGSYGRETTNHGKDTDKEGDQNSRSWKSNSFTRGKGEGAHCQAAPSKQAGPYSFGRGRGDIGHPLFSAGRGRVSSTISYGYPGASRSTLGNEPDKSDDACADTCMLRYSRMELLDIYRVTDVRSKKVLQNTFVDAPPLTIEDLLEPFALFGPTSEESAILKGIDKGDVISSGVVSQGSKDISAGTVSMNTAVSKLNKPAIRTEDIPRSIDEFPVRNTSTINPLLKSSLTQMSKAVGEHSFISLNCSSAEGSSKAPGLAWSHPMGNGTEVELKPAVLSSPLYREESIQQNSEVFYDGSRRDPVFKRQPSGILDHLPHQEDAFMSSDKSTRKFLSYPSPEELQLCYKDPQGRVQGPFSGSDLIGWFENGYFGIDLQVRLADARADAPFMLLGDVMPHLRMKAKAPPGFGVAKPLDGIEDSSRGKITTGNSYQDVSDTEFYKNGQGDRHEASTEAENRFLESLMSAGVQGHGANSAAILHAAGAEGDLNFILSQMSLDRQRPISNPYPYWTGRGTCPTQSKIESMQDSPIHPSKILPSTGEPVSLSAHMDLLSALQAATNKSSSQTVNSGGSGWTNFPEMRPTKSSSQSSMDVIHENLDLHNLHFSSQTGLGAHPQRLQAQNQPSLSHLVGQQGDFSSTMVPLEKFPSELPQNQQMLNLLQKQYMLNQIQMQPPAAPTQLSFLDKLLLLKHQEHEQRQQQLLYQQQLLLSQVLSGQKSQFESSYGLPKAALPMVNAPLDLGPHEALQVTVDGLDDQPTSSHIGPGFQGSQSADCAVSAGPPALHKPHKMFGFHPPLQGQDAAVMQKSQESSRPGPALPKQDGPIHHVTTMGSSSEGVAQETDTSSIQHKSLSGSQSMGSLPSTISEGTGNMTIPDETSGVLQSISSVIEETQNIKTFDGKVPVEGHTDLSSAKEGKSIGMREVKKPSEKKSKKQKNLKSISLKDLVKGSSTGVPDELLKQDAETVETYAALSISAYKNVDGSLSGSFPPRAGDEKSRDTQQDQIPLSSHVLVGKGKTAEVKAETLEAERSVLNLQTNTGPRAWKPAPGLRAKSLLEIQQDEKHKAQVETRISEISLVAPVDIQPTSWVGVVFTDEDGKSIKDAVQEDSSVHSISLLEKKSQLHNLLAEEGPPKSNEVPVDTLSNDKGSLTSSVNQTCIHLDAPAFDDDDDFMETKESRKNRKKAAKAKSSGVKSSSPTTSVDLPSYLLTHDKGKGASQPLMEEELAPPTGPSLADFVFWKEDQGNSTTTPAAWSADLGKIEKPVSLRDILREQQKKAPSVPKQIPIPAPVKAQTNQGSRGSNINTSGLINGSSPNSKSMVQPKAASPVQAGMPRSTRSKSKHEDDLFWGSLDQSKQEAKPSEFPSLVNPTNWNTKGSTAKGASVVVSTHQKPSNFSSGDIPLSSSQVHGHPIPKGRKNAATNYSEATDFREWCEGELSRITGSKDTGFLEYCLQQSTSEAEILLTQNLGSLDRNREFIDKFLNYKDLLPSDVKDIAFKTMEDGFGHVTRTGLRVKDIDGETEDGTSKVAKKKGKKGKKVMPACVLGFNVVNNNRIMKGEIQTIDDE